EEERVASLEALAEVHSRHGHLQEVILQNFVPHPRYYGREVAEIADSAAQAQWADRAPSPGANLDAPASGTEFPSQEPPEGELLEPPSWATPIGVGDMKRLISECRRLMPDVGVQVPPNLSDHWPELVEAGATDLGGLSANGDHISPEEPFPSPHQVRKE